MTRQVFCRKYQAEMEGLTLHRFLVQKAKNFLKASPSKLGRMVKAPNHFNQ